VPGLVMVHEITIGLPDVLGETVTEGAAGEAIEEAGPDTLVVVDDLRMLAGIPLRDRPRHLHDVGRADLPLVALVGRVPGPVAADDDPLVHGAPPVFGRGREGSACRAKDPTSAPSLP